MECSNNLRHQAVTLASTMKMQASILWMNGFIVVAHKCAIKFLYKSPRLLLFMTQRAFINVSSQSRKGFVVNCSHFLKVLVRQDGDHEHGCFTLMCVCLCACEIASYARRQFEIWLELPVTIHSSIFLSLCSVALTAVPHDIFQKLLVWRSHFSAFCCECVSLA